MRRRKELRVRNSRTSHDRHRGRGRQSRLARTCAATRECPYGSCSRAATPLLCCRAAMIVAQALTTNPVCPRASTALGGGFPHLLSVLIAGGRGRNALRNVIKHPADRAAAGLAACIAE